MTIKTEDLVEMADAYWRMYNAFLQAGFEQQQAFDLLKQAMAAGLCPGLRNVDAVLRNGGDHYVGEALRGR